MRKIFVILGAIFLALAAAALVLTLQGKSIGDMFSFSGDKKTPRLPTLPVVQDEVAVNDTLDLTYEERLEKGDYYAQRGFLSYAANEYVKAANLSPDEMTPYLKLIDTHLKLRNYDKALTNAQLVLKKNPDDLKTRFQLVLIEAKLSDFDAAREILQTYFSGPTQTPEVIYYKGLLAALSGAHDEAKANLNAAKDLADPSLKAKVDQVLTAYTQFEVHKEADPLFLSELLAKSFNQVQEYEMAIHLVKEVLKSKPELRDGWVLLGFAYLNLEKYPFALTAFEKAYSLDATWAPTLYFLGVVQKEMSNYAQSIISFNAALKVGFKPKAVIDDQLAQLYFETKDYAKAASAYQEVLKVNQSDINAFVRPILIYIDHLQQPQEALKLAETAALAFPESAMSYNLLGWSYIGMKDYKRALSNLNRALKIDPNLSAAHYNLGMLYQTEGKNQLALKSYQAAYELDPVGSIGSMAAEKYNGILEIITNNN